MMSTMLETSTSTIAIAIERLGSFIAIERVRLDPFMAIHKEKGLVHL
jgi:hypothetical protein